MKNTCNASVETKGFCVYKATNGIKRHLAIDTLGFSFFTLCTPANVSNDAGLLKLLALNIDYFRAKLEQVYPQIMRKIRFERSSKPSKVEKAVAGKTGFVTVPARWIVERSNAWMERCKSLVKNFERTLSHSTTLMLRDLKSVLYLPDRRRISLN